MTTFAKTKTMEQISDTIEDKKMKFDSLLQILALISEEGYSIEGIAAKTKITERTAYRYIKTLKACGFGIVRKNKTLFLDKVPQTFAEIAEKTSITPKEWQLIADAVEASDDPLKEGVMLKIKERTNKTSSGQTVIRKQENINIQHLSTAINGKKQVILKNYSSSNSKTISDRRVEPFAFRNGNHAVICYDVDKKAVRTFKTARIESVQICPEDWKFESRHKAAQTDLFGMSSDTLIPVKLRLNMRAANLLREEFPLSEKMIRPFGQNHFIFSSDIRDLKGIGRFVMGLHDEIEIIEPKELILFLRRHAERIMKQYEEPIMKHPKNLSSPNSKENA